MSRWTDTVQPGSIAAHMVEIARRGTIYWSDMDLYNIATSEDPDRRFSMGVAEGIRVLCASLYCERRERNMLASQLNEIGDPVSLSPHQQLMRCANNHLWIRDIQEGKTECPECRRQR